MPQESRSRNRMLRIALLIGVPLLAFGCWLGIQPDDRLEAFDCPCQWHFLIYDPYDLAAMAHRGMNAELGRKAGAPVLTEHVPDEYFAQSIEAKHPLKPRYFLEYPHALLLLFRAGYWIQPGWSDFKSHPELMPPGLPDCCYHNIARHDPENANQRAIWRFFVIATRFYVGVMVAAWMSLIAVLELGYGPGAELSGGSLLLLLPGAVFFTLNRFDILPALFTALSFACLGRRRIVPSALFLGLATVVKVYPVLFVPLILRYLWPDRRLALRFALVYMAANLLSLSPLLFGDDWPAILAPYRYQLTRPAEQGLTIYGCLLPAQLALGEIGALFRVGVLGAATLLALATPIPDLRSLLRRCAIVLFVFVSLAVFYSPQWILWFAPLLLPLLGRQKRIGKWIVGLDLATYLTFPMWYFVLVATAPEIAKWFYDFPVGGKDTASSQFLDEILTLFGSLLRLARFVCIGVMLWHLLKEEYPVRAWFESAWRRIWRSTPALAGEA